MLSALRNHDSPPLRPCPACDGDLVVGILDLDAPGVLRDVPCPLCQQGLRPPVPLRPDLLAAGAAIDVPLRRRSRHERAMRRVWRGFWLAMAAAVATRLALS